MMSLEQALSAVTDDPELLALCAAHLRQREDWECRKLGTLAAAIANYGSGKWAPSRWMTPQDFFPQLARSVKKKPAKTLSARDVERLFRRAFGGTRKTPHPQPSRKRKTRKR